MNDLTWLSIKTLIVSPTLGETLKTAGTGAKSPDSGQISHSIILFSAEEIRGDPQKQPCLGTLGTTPCLIFLKIKGTISRLELLASAREGHPIRECWVPGNDSPHQRFTSQRISEITTPTSTQGVIGK